MRDRGPAQVRHTHKFVCLSDFLSLSLSLTYTHTHTLSLAVTITDLYPLCVIFFSITDSHTSVTTKNGRNARPPTRDSNQEPNKSEAKREILKFKRLEVFGDHASTKPNTAKMADKPLVKLDLRPSPSHWQNSSDVAPHPPLPLIQRDLKKELPAMTFQFSTGEVIISRNAANAPSPPRDHQRHSFYPKRGPIKSSNVSEAAPPRSDSCASQTEPTTKHSERSGTDANSTDYTMTPDYRNISEFNLTGRGRPRGKL